MDFGTFIAALFFALPAAGLIVLLVILTSRRPTGRSSWVKAVGSIFLIALGVLVLLTVTWSFGPFWVVAILAGGLFVRFAVASRDSIAGLVFSTIGAAMRQNLPLTTALELEARVHTGKRMRALRGICEWLTQGYSLSESLRRGYPRCPGYALGMITTAERIQQVPQAVSSIEADIRDRNRQHRKLQPVNPAYPVMVILVVLAVVSFLMVFVVPSFEKIFSDMEVELPQSTQLLILFARGYSGPVLGGASVLTLGTISLFLYTTFRPRRPDCPHLLSRIGDWMKWHLPVLHSFERDRSLVQATSFLRLSLRSDRTIDEAIAGTCELDVNGCFRRRLGKWRNLVTAGENVAAAARESGVGKALAWAFDPEVNPGNAPAILETLESFHRSHYAHAANLGRFIFWPCVTLALGAVVGVIVYALFTPLVALLEHTMRYMLP